MTREQIEKAAQDKAKELRMNANSVRTNIDVQNIFQIGFMAGAQWRINSVWATRLSNSIPSAGSMSMRRITRSWRKDTQANQENMTTTDNYARELLYEAARLLSIRCPRCARARLRRIARHDVETTGADYEEALRQRINELNELTSNN